jgi:N-acetylneuraminic acid mutarotase
MPCSNDECDEIISRRDKEIHEKKVCDFREVKCDYCAQMVLYKDFMQHTCPPRQEIREMKAELREVRSTQDEMLRMMSNLTRMVSNIPQRPEASHVSSVQECEIVVAGGSFCKSVEVFNMATKTWRSLSEMNECRHDASSVLYQGHMIVTGGYSDQELDSVEKLNLVDGQWIEESHFKLPAPSSAHTCVVHQNRLLVIGGEIYGMVHDTIHEIQLTPPHTSRLLTDEMPQAICSHGTVIVNDKVYIIGGSTTESCKDATDTVLMFDPATNTCTELNSLPYPVSEMATVAWKDNVVVLGGEGKEGNILNTVILYNVATKRHSMLPEMRQKRSGCTAVTIGDNIITMGGRDETYTKLSSVECYNFQTNTWTEFPAMAEARAYATAVVTYP